MPKVIPPEVLALAPNGFEHFFLRCVVCGLELPSSRRAYGHHAGACSKTYKLFCRFLISRKKCLACQQPATPEERAEFKAWRRSRGDIGDRPGKVKGKKYPKKTLDNPEGDSGTPDIALCDAKEREKPQGIVAENDAIGSQQANDLTMTGPIGPSAQLEPFLTILGADSD